MRWLVVFLILASVPAYAADSAWDEELYQRAGRRLRAATDALAENEGVPGHFRATAWGKARTHIDIYLDTYRVTGAMKYLEFAKTPADFLIAARQPSGGYAHTLYVNELGSEETLHRVFHRALVDRPLAEADE